MEKLVTLKLSTGSFADGFSVILQIDEEDGRPVVEMQGELPPAPELEHTYQQWQVAYRRLGLPYRLEARQEGVATNVSVIEDCREIAQRLIRQFNAWMASDLFRPIQDKLLEKLDPQASIRIMVQTSLTTVQRLPWHTWKLCDRYPKAEIALSAPTFERVDPVSSHQETVRVLAVFGNSEGIDTQTDQALLNHLPNAHVEFLVEPNRQQLNEALWAPQGWDILFFAGHSHTQVRNPTEWVEADVTGHLWINQTESLTIAELKHGLKKSLERGLKIAIFNSCDGLGLAHNLADLHIPQVLVMREPVPDRVAHTFLKSFLQAFARGESFYLAVREAREKLHGLEDNCPCATWLPIIFQNPAAVPPAWKTLTQHSAKADQEPRSRQHVALRWRQVLTAGVFVLAGTLGIRYLGWLQPLELRAYDHLMRLRPQERSDPRLLVVTVTEEDVQAQDPNQRRGSLSDAALSALLDEIEAGDPEVIGLDIYRDYPVLPGQKRLAEQLGSYENLFAVCKTSDTENDMPGIGRPDEIPENRTGFSDFVIDPDNAIRRQLVGLTPDPASPCQSRYSLNALLALYYLNSRDIQAEITPDGYLQVGQVNFKPLKNRTVAYQTIDDRGYQLLLNYRNVSSPKDIADTVTLSQVLTGKVNPEIFRDRIVLIGTTAPSFGDYWKTAYSRNNQYNQQTAGVFMQAHMVSQMISAVLDERPLIRTLPGWADVIWIGGWALVGGFAIYITSTHFPSKFHAVKIGASLLSLEIALFLISWVSLSIISYWLSWVPAAIVIPGTAATAIVLSSQKKESKNK